MSPRGQVSVRTVLLVLLGLELALAVGLTSLLWYRRGRAAVEVLEQHVVDQLVDRLTSRVARFLSAPHECTEVMSALLDEGALSLDRMPDNAAVLHRVLLTYPQFSYVEIGMPNNDFVGVERRGGVYNLELRDGRGDPRLFTYQLDTDGRIDPSVPVIDQGEYQVVGRPWFEAAVSARGPAWSEPYVFASMPPRIGVSAVRPRLDAQGEVLAVIACDIILGDVDVWLRTQAVATSGRSFIVGTDGLLLANSSRHPSLLHEGDGVTRVAASAHADPLIAGAGALLGDLAGEAVALRRATVDGARVVIRASPIPDPHGLGATLVVVVPESDFLGGIERNARVTWLLFAGVLLVVTTTILLTTRGLGRVVAEVSDDLDALADFRIEARTSALSDLADMRTIQEGVASMKSALGSFARFVPEEVVRSLLRARIPARVHLEPATVTVGFSGIDAFASLVETVPSSTLVALIGPYYEAVTEEVGRGGGVVDKFLGETVMAFWNAPEPVAGHPLEACRAALRCQAVLEPLAATWAERGLPPLAVRWGLHCGDVRVGNLGTRDRLNFTVLGDTVNLAARVAALARRYDASLLVTDAVIDACGDALLSRPVDRVRVKGRQAPVGLFEVLAIAEAATPAHHARARALHEAFSLYLERRFAEAAAVLEAHHRADPDDGAAAVLAERVASLQATPPPDDWSGEHVLTSKT